MVPISEGTLKVVCVTNRPHSTPDKRAGSRHQDHERVYPRLEVDGKQQVDQDDGEEQSQSHLLEGGLHRERLPVDDDGRALGRVFLHIPYDLLDVGGGSAEVTVLHAGEHIEHRQDLILAEYRRRGVPADRRQIAEQLRAAVLSRFVWASGWRSQIGIAIRSSTEFILYCGVCAATIY